jgi:hypothetical protein
MKNDLNKSDVIINLHSKGYDQDFILNGNEILYLQQGRLLPIYEFAISEALYRSKISVHGEQFFIYALSAIHSDLKGILVTGKLLSV